MGSNPVVVLIFFSLKIANIDCENHFIRLFVENIIEKLHVLHVTRTRQNTYTEWFCLSLESPPQVTPPPHPLSIVVRFAQ